MIRRAAAIAGLAWLAVPTAGWAASPGDAEDNSPAGVSALRSLAEANGHHANLINDSFRVPDRPGVLFVVEPTSPFSDAEAGELVRWMTGGGVVVYASTGADPVLETALGIARSSQAAAFEVRATPGTPLLAGVGSVQMQSADPLASPTGSQVAILRSRSGDVVGVAAPFGRGHLFALAGSGPLTNGDLANADNGVLAADLVAAAGGSAEVSFDDFHHGGGGGGNGSLSWMGTPWGLAILLVVLVAFFLLLLRGRVFGPRIPLRAAADPSSAEFTSAVGAMLRRARARQQTVSRLLAATRSALALQAGIRAGGDPEHLEAALRQRSPALADELSAATARAAAVRDEKSLAEAAANLHRLARPPLKPAPRADTPRRR